MRLDPASPAQWTALLLIGASGILLLYNTLPVALAYPRAGTTALVLFSLFAIPFWWLRGRVADRLALPQLQAMVALHDDRELDDPTAFAWTKGSALGEFAQECGGSHYAWAREAIAHGLRLEAGS